MKASPARVAALDVVRAVRERDAYAQEVLAKRVDASDLQPSDRAFATRLALGVVSSQGTLDEVIDRALRSPSDVKPDVRDALRISTYEIVFLHKSPHAAVDQGVELVRSFAPQATRLANAALHKVVEQSRAFPYGDPAKDLAALARLNAFPLWLAKRLVRELGAQDAAAFMAASNEPAPLFIAVNACKASDEAVLRVFKRAGEGIEPAEAGGLQVPGCYRLADNRALLVPDIKQLLSQGRVIVSDAASQLVASRVVPQRRPASFLEVGAGRGTKTILLQSAALRTFGSQIAHYATLDIHPFKAKLLAERANNAGVCVDEAMSGDALKLDEVVGERRFDAVFIDAPCTGLGTLRRHPEIRWRIDEHDIARCACTQKAMLKAAASHVAPGGELLYATCTVTHEENIEVVKGFLAQKAGCGFELAPIDGRSCVATRLAPGSPDAHFAVRLRRVG